MRIAVIGAGAVGGYFGGRLAHGGEDVVFIARGQSLKAIREKGLRIEDVSADFTVTVKVTDDPDSPGFVDVVLLAVKGWQVPEAIETMRPLMGPNTYAVAVMDGVEAPDQLAAAFGKPRVVGGLAVMLGWVVTPGHIRNTMAQSSISLGELDGHQSERVLRLQQAFEQGGVIAKIAPDILAIRWEKLIMVGPWSSIGAITRAPLGVVRKMPETRKFLEETMQEVLAVAVARGAKLSNDTVERAMDWLDHVPGTAIGNMRDVVDGRPSELETEVGAVVRLASALGVDVPRHAFLYAGLLPQEERARGEIEFPT